MHLISPHRLVAVQLHDVVPNLLFVYRKRDFISPTLRFMDWREVRSPKYCEWSQWRLRQTQGSPYPLSLVLPSHLLRLHILLGLSFMTDTLTDPHLVFFTSLAKSLYICALAFVIPSLHIWTISLYLSKPRVPASTGCAFLSYSSVWGADLALQTLLVYSLPCLIS